MALFSESALLSRSGEMANVRSFSANASRQLQLEAKSAAYVKQYDIFLSHNHLDALLVYGLKQELERRGYSCYVYWVDDQQSAGRVDPGTAERIRLRMRSSKALLYASSANAATSKWMPWELGYFDGFRERVAVVPISRGTDYYFDGYKGQEYLDLYPYISRSDDGREELKVWSRDRKSIRNLRDWLQ